jgi:hypothetical protein
VSRSSDLPCGSYFIVTGHTKLGENKQTIRRSIMKTILSALVALSFVAGVVAPAAAAPYSSSLIEQLDKEGRGGHNG